MGEGLAMYTIILYAKIGPAALVRFNTQIVYIGALPSCWETCVEACCRSDLKEIISSPRKFEDFIKSVKNHTNKERKPKTINTEPITQELTNYVTVITC